MKFNKKLGISLIIISVSVIIILIMISVITFSLIENNNNAKKLEFSQELSMVQMAVDVYYNKNGSYPIEQSITISDVDPTLASEQFKYEDRQSNVYRFDIIDYDKIDISNLKYGNKKNGVDDVYIVSSKTGLVYYAKGVKIGNSIYYRIDDILDSTNEDMMYSKSGISFFEYAEDSLEKTVTIKVPSSYKNITVLADNTNVGDYTQNNEYYIYTYKTLKDSIYTIRVKYLDGTTQKEIKYLVD